MYRVRWTSCVRLTCIANAAIALCSVLEPSPVVGQPTDVNVCKERKGADAVAACTRLIALGKSKRLTLYLHCNDRGGAYQWLGNHQRAIEDFGEAISLDRNLPYSFVNRGVS
jgi:hypothetical protein